MSTLTNRQQQVLDTIRRLTAEFRMSPTRAELAEALGLSSTNTVDFHLRALARKGAIRLFPGRNRNIQLSDAAEHVQCRMLPLVGQVAAGSPILADENIEDYHPCPDIYQPKPDYWLRVRGDSMIDAHILDGNLLGVHKSPQASSGEIVVARLDDEVTVKLLEHSRDGIRLLPKNPAYEPIVIDPQRHQFAIEGIAVCVLVNIRKSLRYHNEDRYR